MFLQSIYTNSIINDHWSASTSHCERDSNEKSSCCRVQVEQLMLLQSKWFESLLSDSNHLCNIWILRLAMIRISNLMIQIVLSDFQPFALFVKGFESVTQKFKSSCLILHEWFESLYRWFESVLQSLHLFFMRDSNCWMGDSNSWLSISLLFH